MPGPADDGEDDGAAALLDDPVQLGVDAHSSGSTKTSISPPHGSPMPSAMSSVMPYVSSRGVAAGEHLLRGEADVALDAPPENGAGQLSASR